MNEIKALKTKEVELSDELFCEELDDEQLESVVGGSSTPSTSPSTASQLQHTYRIFTTVLSTR